LKITAVDGSKNLQTLDCLDNFQIFVQLDSSNNGVFAKAHLASEGAVKR